MMSEFKNYDHVGDSSIKDIDSLHGNDLDSETVVIPAGADRLMPSPPSVQLNQELQLLDREKGWNGQYSWVENEKRVLFERISPQTESAYAAGVKQWLSDHHNMHFGVNNAADDWLLVRERISKSYRDLMDVYDQDGKARFVAITPTFSDILNAVRERNKEPTTVPMHDTDEGWKLDLHALEETLQFGDVLILTNPNNPNGYIYTEEDLKQIISLCKKHSVKIISDDIWSDQVHCPGKRHVPIINVAMQEGYENNVSMLYSTGKAFNTSLIPCSVAIIPNAYVRDRLQRTADSDNPSELGAQLAVDTINSDGSDYMEALNPRLRQNAEFAARIFQEMGCRAHPPESTSVMFVKLNDVVVQERNAMSSKLLSLVGIQSKAKRTIPDLMEELSIGYSYGQNFGLPGYVRINIGVPFPVIESRLNKLKSRWNAQLQNS